MALTRALVFCGFHIASGSDVESMIQHAVKATDSLHFPGTYSPNPFGAFVSQELLKRNLAVDEMTRTIERDFPFANEHADVPDMPAIMETIVNKATNAFTDSKEALKKTWEEFHTLMNISGSASPKQLLKQAKAAVLDTGLLSEISQAMLKLTASTVMPFFTAKYDSYVVGFDVSMGQWMRGLGLPVMKGRGKLFLNWSFERDDIRACVSAAADDTPTYVKWRHHKHPKQVGPNLFLGLAKWDDVPGWSFGTQAVLDMYDVDVEDLGMKWTLSEEPEPACFFLDLCLFDCGFWKAVASLQQTDAEIERHPYPLDDPRSSYSALKVLKREWVKALAPTPPPRPPVKAAMFVERTWCNRDYILEDEPLERWRHEEAARIAAEEAAEATRTTTAAPTPQPPAVRVTTPSTTSTTTTVITGWYMGAQGESCEDACAAAGEICDSDTLQGQTDAKVEGIAEAIGAACSSWLKATRSDVPMPAQWTDGNCYHAFKPEYIHCDRSHSSATRLCACMPTTTATTTTISTTTTTTTTSTTATTTTSTTTATTTTSTTTTSITSTTTTTTSTTTTTTTPYSPWNGVCPQGYLVEDQVASNWAGCPGTESPGNCVLTRIDAEALCNSNPECAGIGEPSKTGGWAYSPGYVAPGKFPLGASSTWRSCTKGFAKILVADGVVTSRMFLSSTEAGDKIDLHTQEDGSGRQRWTLAKGSGDWYNIVVQGGISTGLKFLSAKSDGSMVDLNDKDDGSGRQRWVVHQGDGGWFTIQVSGGVIGGTFLSTTTNGDVVDLLSQDDGSGRQRWELPGFVHPLHPPYASVLVPGTCSEHAWDPIATAAGCEAAAVAMNYPHEGHFISIYHDTDERPPGCMMYTASGTGFKLEFNRKMDSAFADSSWSDLYTICKRPPTTTTTVTTTTATTTTTTTTTTPSNGITKLHDCTPGSYYGTSWTALDTPTLESCAAKCSETAGCRCFAYGTQEGFVGVVPGGDNYTSDGQLASHCVLTNDCSNQHGWETECRWSVYAVDDAVPPYTTAQAVECLTGADFTSEESCKQAAVNLGFTYSNSWNGPNDHKYCVYDPARDAVFFNTAPSSGAPVYQSVCKAQVYETTNKYYCEDGTDYTTESECKLASATLGLTWGGPYHGQDDHRYCLFAGDHRQLTYFNTAAESASKTPPSAYYSSICEAEQCSTNKFGIDFCNTWCNTDGVWGCGISTLSSADARNTNGTHYTCSCAGCNGCGFPEKCSHDKFGIDFCSSWCNTPGKWDCGTSTLLGTDALNTGGVDYTCSCAHCNGCGAASSCSAPYADLQDVGYPDEYRGWFDVQGCGTCNDYCRWIGTGGSGGDPANPNPNQDAWWSCALAGGSSQYTARDYFQTWSFTKCGGRGGATP